MDFNGEAQSQPKSYPQEDIHMNALQAHKLLSNAYEKLDNNCELSRQAVLALLDLYNFYAKQTPEIYRPLKNAGDEGHVWIVAE